MAEAQISTKERIIDAAIELFAEKGYMEASLRDIAMLVGIKPASIYNHFTSKDEMLNVILDEYVTVIKENTISAERIAELIDTTDARTILNKMFFLFSPDKAIRHTSILKIIMHEQFRVPRATAFMRDIMFRNNEAYVKEILDKLVEAKKIRSIETAIYAKILISLTVSTSTEMMFYGFEGYQALEKVSRRKATNFLLDQIVLPQSEL